MATKASKAAPARAAESKRSIDEANDFLPGSGNVFADLGLADADDLMFKADLAARLADALRASGLKQQPAAALLGWTQPEVSAFTKGRISGFSVERIMRALKKLGKSVEVHIKDDAGELIVAV